jgi:hypothetical protein
VIFRIALSSAWSQRLHLVIKIREKLLRVASKPHFQG